MAVQVTVSPGAYRANIAAAVYKIEDYQVDGIPLRIPRDFSTYEHIVPSYKAGLYSIKDDDVCYEDSDAWEEDAYVSNRDEAIAIKDEFEHYFDEDSPLPDYVEYDTARFWRHP